MGVGAVNYFRGKTYMPPKKKTPPRPKKTPMKKTAAKPKAPIRPPPRPTQLSNLPKNIGERIYLTYALAELTGKNNLSGSMDYLREGRRLTREGHPLAELFSIRKWRQLIRTLDPLPLYEDHDIFYFAAGGGQYFQYAIEQARVMIQRVPRPPRDVLLTFLVNDTTRYRAEYFELPNRFRIVWDMFYEQFLSLAPFPHTFVTHNAKGLLDLLIILIDIHVYPTLAKTSTVTASTRAMQLIDTYIALFPTLQVELYTRAATHVIQLYIDHIDSNEQQQEISWDRLYEWLHKILHHVRPVLKTPQEEEACFRAILLKLIVLNKAPIITWFIRLTGLDIHKTLSNGTTYFTYALKEQARHSAKALVNAGFNKFTIHPRTPRYRNNLNANSNLNSNNNISNNLNRLARLNRTRTRSHLINRVLRKHPDISARLVARLA